MTDEFTARVLARKIAKRKHRRREEIKAAITIATLFIASLIPLVIGAFWP